MPSDALSAFSLVTHVVRKGDGQGRVNYEIVREALDQGMNVTLFASEIAPELQDNPLVTWHPVPRAKVPSALLRHQFFAIHSARLISRHRRGPLLSNGWITHAPAELNASHFVHGAWLRSKQHPWARQRTLGSAYQAVFTKLNSWLEQRAYHAAKRVIAVSRQVSTELVDFARVPPERIKVIPNGVDIEEFHPGPRTRKEFGLPENVPLALFAGDIKSTRKNLDTVLHALVEAPGIHLAVAGWLEGSPYPALADQLGLTERVHFLGGVRTMPQLMRSCDAFVFPSRYEACSLVLLEAMASGLPIATARTTGGAELVPDEAGLLLASAEDAVELSKWLAHSVNQPSRLESMGQASRHAAEKLTWGVMAQEYLRELAPWSWAK